MKIKLTPIKFDGQFADGVLELEGMAFDWNGIQFAVHRKRPVYDHPDDPLSVSHVGTGFSVGGIPDTSDHMKAARYAVERLEKVGLERVTAALDKARAMGAPATRLAA